LAGTHGAALPSTGAAKMSKFVDHASVLPAIRALK